VTSDANDRGGQGSWGRGGARRPAHRLPWATLASVAAACTALLALAALATTAAAPLRLPRAVLAPSLVGAAPGGSAGKGEPAEVEVVRPRPSVAVTELPPEGGAQAKTAATTTTEGGSSTDGGTSTTEAGDGGVTTTTPDR
jgi:hypothetical protein